MKKKVGWLKYVFILILELVTQVTVAPIILMPFVYFFSVDYGEYWLFFFIGIIIVAMFLAIPIKFRILRWVEKLLPPSKPLKYYYWINAVVSVFVNPVAFFWAECLQVWGTSIIFY